MEAPAVEPGVGCGGLPADEPEKLTGAGRVLIADDNPVNAMIARRALESAGFTVTVASTGIEALEAAKSMNPALVLMDLRMPEMDGIQATRAIRNSGREYNNTPIIALTADASAETNAACMAAGADIFLTKPIMAREVIEAIRFVRRFQDQDENASISVA